MCYNKAYLTKRAEKLAKRYGHDESEVRFVQEQLIKLNISPVYNASGFNHPSVPVIINKSKEIHLFSWGLIPFWAKDIEIRKNTLNAKIETLNEKPSFRNCINNRCLVIADGFYEWQWLDPKGKNKQKYKITLEDNSLFALAGLWSEWVNKDTGELTKSYTILTTEANSLMSKIHNSKKRMPVVLLETKEKRWLLGDSIDNFRIPDSVLKAEIAY